MIINFSNGNNYFERDEITLKKEIIRKKEKKVNR